ncbi:MAG: zinc-ribbon domain-containing protein [Deltaproteobacteria bacterium]|nr:zinc-ribbon domain-containing protein [Deltaproteobacteria bacterium]
MTAVASGCPVCGAPQSPGMHFCEQCGARLEPPVAPSSCPGCGNRVTPGERFCEQCGTALSR